MASSPPGGSKEQYVEVKGEEFSAFYKKVESCLTDDRAHHFFRMLSAMCADRAAAPGAPSKWAVLRGELDRLSRVCRDAVEGEIASTPEAARSEHDRLAEFLGGLVTLRAPIVALKFNPLETKEKDAGWLVRLFADAQGEVLTPEQHAHRTEVMRGLPAGATPADYWRALDKEERLNR
jgi:hypothetical protein